MIGDPVGGGEGLATRRVTDRVLAAHPDLEQAVVADRDRVRPAGLADDDRIGGVVVAHVRRPVGGALLLDGADDAQLRALRRLDRGEGLQEADQAALGVDAPAPAEGLVIPADRPAVRDGVEVPEHQQPSRARPARRDEVARRVDPGVDVAPGAPGHEVLGELALVPGHRGDLDGARQQRQVGVGWRGLPEARARQRRERMRPADRDIGRPGEPDLGRAHLLAHPAAGEAGALAGGDVGDAALRVGGVAQQPGGIRDETKMIGFEDVRQLGGEHVGIDVQRRATGFVGDRRREAHDVEGVEQGFEAIDRNRSHGAGAMIAHDRAPPVDRGLERRVEGSRHEGARGRDGGVDGQAVRLEAGADRRQRHLLVGGDDVRHLVRRRVADLVARAQHDHPHRAPETFVVRGDARGSARDHEDPRVAGAQGGDLGEQLVVALARAADLDDVQRRPA